MQYKRNSSNYHLEASAILLPTVIFCSQKNHFNIQEQSLGTLALHFSIIDKFILCLSLQNNSVKWRQILFSLELCASRHSSFSFFFLTLMPCSVIWFPKVFQVIIARESQKREITDILKWRFDSSSLSPPSSLLISDP